MRSAVNTAQRSLTVAPASARRRAQEDDEGSAAKAVLRTSSAEPSSIVGDVSVRGDTPH